MAKKKGNTQFIVNQFKGKKSIIINNISSRIHRKHWGLQFLEFPRTKHIFFILDKSRN